MRAIPSKIQRLLIIRSSCMALVVLLLASCSSGPREWRYQPVKGRTASLHNGIAIPPRNAPPAVVRAIAAGNEITGLPYKYGGGHAQRHDSGYDCSGSASYILSSAGLMRGSMPSSGFKKFGRSGRGEWISVYATSGHVFLEVAGLRYDTGWTNQPRGPRWTTRTRPTRGYVVRHPAGF